MDATRTQIEAAAQRFHYRRGFDDAMAQVQQEQVFNAVVVVVLIFAAFLAGWVAKKWVSLQGSNHAKGSVGKVSEERTNADSGGID